jgi:nucleoside-diphosphate-sugar epimerase
VLNNYLRACLFGRRNMHLVPVRDVVAAVLHVATMPAPLRGEVYIVSADADPANAFDRVEAELRLGLGLAARMLPVVRVPPGALGFLLRLLGRSETNLRRVYDSAKLRATGFVPVDSVAVAVREFGEQYGREA